MSLSVSGDLPDLVQTLFSWFGLAAGDASFIHPGCAGLSSYSVFFGINVGSTFALSLTQTYTLTIAKNNTLLLSLCDTSASVLSLFSSVCAIRADESAMIAVLVL